jgi:hypothetical protein
LENTGRELGFNENKCSCTLNVGVQEDERGRTLGNTFEKHKVG